MEILDSVIIDSIAEEVFLSFIVTGVFALLVAIVFLASREYSKRIKLLVRTAMVLSFIIAVPIGWFNSIERGSARYEELTVIVKDWNIVYKEGWKVLSHNGDRAVLQKKID